MDNENSDTPHVEEGAVDYQAQFQQCWTQAVEAVDQAMACALSRVKLPSLLEQFFQNVWRSVLIDTYMQEGENSWLWELHLQITEEMIWSFGPKVSKEEEDYLEKMIPHLVDILKDYMQEGGWQVAQQRALLEELGDCHSEVICRAGESSRGRGDGFDMAESLVLDSLLDGELWEEEADYYDERVSQLPLDSWVEFSDVEAPAEIARLVQRSDSDGLLTFANWKNRVVRECSEVELADMLRRWDARILRNVPVIKQAWVSLVSLLQAK